MTQTPTPPTETDLYALVIDLRTDEEGKPQYFVRGQTRTVTLDFGDNPVGEDDILTLPLWKSWEDERPFATLSKPQHFRVEGTKLHIDTLGDQTSFWPRQGSEYAVLELKGVLNHHDKDRQERPTNGRVLVKLTYVDTLDRR